MKKLMLCVAVVLAVCLVLSVSKNVIAKVAIEKGVETVTGLKLEMQSLNIGILNTLVGIKNLKLYNPDGYKEKVMVDLPEAYVNYDLPAIFKNMVHLREVRLDLKTFVVEKNSKGELNLDALKPVQSGKKGKAGAKQEPAQEAKQGKAPEIKIDLLTLKIGKVVYLDYSKGGTPQMQEFNLNINEQYRDITDPNALVGAIVVKALMNTTIGQLANFDVKGLQGQFGNTLAGAQKLTGEAQTKLVTATQGMQKTLTDSTSTVAQKTQAVTDAAKTTTETVKKTAEDLTKSFKLPFGGKEE
ncbi:MAG TPA: hypothetical protein PKY78_01385 [Candidatus Omnitrophota bacterium]|nr:hypothetical protein [Candidatus Omnitrophota bacterium]HPS19633.1 hypothetical protein [Candidatus Omnitrophota bacterium]